MCARVAELAIHETFLPALERAARGRNKCGTSGVISSTQVDTYIVNVYLRLCLCTLFLRFGLLALGEKTNLKRNGSEEALSFGV